MTTVDDTIDRFCGLLSGQVFAVQREPLDL
jgi:hypothetical protein